MGLGPLHPDGKGMEGRGGEAEETRICAAEMAVRYATVSACRKVHP